MTITDFILLVFGALTCVFLGYWLAFWWSDDQKKEGENNAIKLKSII